MQPVLECDPERGCPYDYQRRCGRDIEPVRLELRGGLLRIGRRVRAVHQPEAGQQRVRFGGDSDGDEQLQLEVRGRLHDAGRGLRCVREPADEQRAVRGGGGREREVERMRLDVQRRVSIHSIDKSWQSDLE